MKDESAYFDVAGAILDGVPIDWTVLGQATAGADRSFLDQLWALGRIADVHRRAPDAGRAQWGPFAIVERLGSGTFGDVFRAFDPSLDRHVALKLLRTPAAGRHIAEGRLLARVRHPNIVTVYGAAAHDGIDGIWMELVDGRTLADIVAEKGPFDPHEVTAIGIDLCRALSAVHAVGLLHGDIKAQNVMREDGGRIVLMDFGTSRIAADDPRAAGLAGTPLYVAPEALAGEAPDGAADVYGVGVTLYFLLTGTFPVEGRTLREIRAAHERGARMPVRERRPDVPRRIAAIVDRATARKPQRFASAAALAIGAWRMRAPAISADRLVVSLTPSAVVARSEDGAELWRHGFPATHKIDYANPGRTSQTVGGANGAVYVATGIETRLADDVPRSGRLLKFSPSGALQGAFTFDDRATFNGKPYGPPWAITGFAVDETNPESRTSRRIAVAAHHFQWSASMVTVLDDRFGRRGTYWQWGWIEWLFWLPQDRLLVGGYDDVHEGGIVALLDPSKMDGEAPETIGGRPLCGSCGRAEPLRIFVMPPTEINKVTVSRFNRAVVQKMPDRIVARTIEVEQTADRAAIDAVYEFTQSLELVRASFGGGYWDMHAALERQGKLTHSRENCPDRDGPREVLAWQPTRGWQRMAVPRPTN